MSGSPMVRFCAIAGALPFLSHAAAAQSDVNTGEFTVERPTLVSLGFERRIDGDDNHGEIFGFGRPGAGASCAALWSENTDSRLDAGGENGIQVLDGTNSAKELSVRATQDKRLPGDA